MSEYEDLLNRAMKKLPEKEATDVRFDPPKVLGHIQGNKTVISNFSKIAEYIGRSQDHVVKYVLRELATPGELTKSALILGTKIPASRINEKISQYVKEFVMCSECNRPDTKLSSEDRITFMKCNACGAKKALKGKI